MSEQIFFEHDGVVITSSRFVVDGQTYAMANVTSVTPLERKPNRRLPSAIVLIGLVVCIYKSFAAGLILMLAGGAWLAVQRSMFHVMLRTSGGETSALRSRQRKYVEHVVTAVNQAMVVRG